ncbi:hypothetical protein GPECTOR_3g47 [Gonium pectorale]|uniref:Uncharacterized protein n=1 Tax=Gonium pectorale TaxID=33097 RepID=A0A150H0D5_GONPE|nr:hypothetical protein GPECTOR_3g47 [Gonium pectorale]|eukprot:KXZ55338.1 hypothetical protein GPECTOR_3g47 [Gonium pectorale]
MDYYWRRIAVSEAWGEGEQASTSGRDSASSPLVADVGGGGDQERRARQLLPRVLRSAAGAGAGAAAPQGGVPTLRALVLAFLGRHVTDVVAQLGPHLAPLPSDVKACLLCVARRRGVLRNAVLLALADEGWTLMDLAGATALTERAVRQALLRCPRLRALDLRGATAASASLLAQLPELCPGLQVLGVGGSRALDEAALEVLGDILPHVRLRAQPQEVVQESWEEAVQGGSTSLPDPGLPCGLQRLELLVWPHAPPAAVHTLRTVSPTVTLLDELPRLAGDPEAADAQSSRRSAARSGGGGGTLDDCLAALVAEGAWRGAGAGDRRRNEAAAFEELHIAEKFRIAYEQQDARLRVKAQREAAAEARREMRASAAARELAKWLDAE